jgi:voltage-gated potassium channel
MVFFSIALSVAIVILESIPSVAAIHGPLLRHLEWGITIWFTAEYVMRLITAHQPIKYATGFYGIIDLLAVIPTYLSLFFVGSQSLMVLRAFRFLRIFRVFKLTRFVSEASTLMIAMKASRQKITVFLCAVLTIALLMGTLMYLVEGENAGFNSIPQGIYWAIVTMTTVGYGDLAPQSPLGKFLASILMLTGYAIIAIPTGIVSVEIAEASRSVKDIRVCPGCSRPGHDKEAAFCRFCGGKLAA